ncbi:MAG: chemotaxis protein [Pseudoramibacter sp.]
MASEAQLKANKKYETANGIISKSFKIKKTLADDFKAACKKAGTSQSKAISKLIQDFIDDVNRETD